MEETETSLDILKPFAEAVLRACPFKDLLYARVDIALTKRAESDLTPVLMELELFEPDVFVGKTVDQSVVNYVDAIQSKISSRK